jgi:hypothetical protein
MDYFSADSFYRNFDDDTAQPAASEIENFNHSYSGSTDRPIQLLQRRPTD